MIVAGMRAAAAAAQGPSNLRAAERLTRLLGRRLPPRLASDMRP